MQKKIIALALAGLASSAAFAQSNVTIYGRMDYGYLVRGDNNGGSPEQLTKQEFASGIGSGSRIGFKGAEDLGNGLKAIFQAEFGLGMDANTGLNSTRNAYVGLTGNFGTVVGGRLDGVRYGIYNKYDAFGGGHIGNFTQMTSQVDRANNAIAYISPAFFGGLTATLAYSSHIGDSNALGLGGQEGSGNRANAAGQNNKGNDYDGVLYTAMVNYTNGPLSLTGDYEQINFNGGDLPNTAAGSFALDQVEVYTVGGSWDFGVVKVAALYDNLTADGRTGREVSDVDSWFISASAPFGKFLAKATYGETDENAVANAKSKKIGVGLDYNFSKRTKLYTGYAYIDNDDGAALMLSPAANSYGRAGNYGTQGFELGMAHVF